MMDQILNQVEWKGEGEVKLEVEEVIGKEDMGGAGIMAKAEAEAEAEAGVRKGGMVEAWSGDDEGKIGREGKAESGREGIVESGREDEADSGREDQVEIGKEGETEMIGTAAFVVVITTTDHAVPTGADLKHVSFIACY